MELRDKSCAPHVVLVCVQLMFGSLAPIGKTVLNVIPSLSLVGFRIGGAALALFLLARYRSSLALELKSDYWRFAILAFFGVAFNQIMFVTGLSFTKAVNTSLLAITIPIFALSAGAFLGKERLTLKKVFGIFAAACGVVYLIDPGRASFSSETTIGDLMIVVNSLSYGIFVATAKDTITRNGALKSITWMFIFAALLCVPLGAYSLRAVPLTDISINVWLTIAYIVIISTTLPYLLNTWALSRVNPSTVAIYVYLQPLIGVCMAALVLGESLTLRIIIAALLIFLGVFLVTYERKRGHAAVIETLQP
jgi:drug/metabolite transporter (DMT)-like permease